MVDRHHPNQTMRFRYLVVAFLMSSLAATATAQTWGISSTGQGSIAFSGNGAEELGGLTWAGGTQYYAVTDNEAKMFPITIQVNSNSGAIESVNVAPVVTLAIGTDLEGIAYNSANSSVFVSDEAGPAIREYSIATGSVLQTLTLPPVFAGHRSNLSLESLSLQPGGNALWTANEEALTADGPISSFTAGTVVRLQRFNAALSASGQWAYVTDAIHGDIGNNGRDTEASGVSDLVALPTGDLLVMERALGAVPFGFRIRLYQVDLTTATDISSLADLDGETYTPVTKTLLWEGSFPGNNFEGIALGPQISGGVYSLLLVSDGGGGVQQALYALTLAPPPCTPAPLSGCRSPERSGLAFRRVDGQRDKLSWTWRRGTIENVSAFGNPTLPGGTPFGVCIYDSPGGVLTLAWSARVRAGAEWRAVGSRGFRYRERDGAADGIVNMVMRSGDGNASAALRGKGVNLQPPSNPPSGPMLEHGTEVVVQLVNLENSAECLAASYSSAATDSPDEYKARF